MVRLKENYEFKDLCFERVKSKHRHLFKTFESFQKDLKEFLIEDAIISQEMCVSNTFLVFDKNNFNNYNRKRNKRDDTLLLLGYVTILNDSIRLDGALKQQFQEKGIIYRSLPSLKIGRLCVDNRYLRKRIGKCILLWVIYRVAHLNQNIACRFITLDAKRNSDHSKDSLYFYKRFGLSILKNKDKSESEIMAQKSGSTPMYLDLYHIIRVFKAKLNF